MTRYEIGLIISKARKKQGFSQLKLAHLSGYSQSLVSSMEHGQSIELQPVLDVLEALDLNVGIS